MPVNPRFNAPQPPGPWVDQETCHGCGAVYAQHRGGIGFAAAADELRQAAKRDGDDGGGFRSRGPVLWVMRVAKLTDWYMAHAGCGGHWVDGLGRARSWSRVLF